MDRRTGWIVGAILVAGLMIMGAILATFGEKGLSPDCRKWQKKAIQFAYLIDRDFALFALDEQRPPGCPNPW